MVGDTSIVNCPFKGVDILQPPFIDFGVKPCDSRGIQKGRVWRAIKEKAESRQLDRVFGQLSGLKDEDRICTAHFALLSDLCRSPRRQKELEEFLSKSKSKAKRSPDQAPKRATPPGGTEKSSDPKAKPTTRGDRRPSVSSSASGDSRRASSTTGSQPRGPTKSTSATALKNAAADTKRRPTVASPVEPRVARQASTSNLPASPRTSPPAPRQKAASLTSSTRSTVNTGRVHAMAAIFGGGENPGAPAVKSQVKMRKPKVAPEQNAGQNAGSSSNSAHTDTKSSVAELAALEQRVIELEAALHQSETVAQNQEAELAEAVLQRDILSSVRDELMSQIRMGASQWKGEGMPEASEKLQQLGLQLQETTQRLDVAKQELDRLRGQLVSALAQRDGYDKNRQELAKDLKRLENREKDNLKRTEALENQLREMQTVLQNSAGTATELADRDHEIADLEVLLDKQKVDFLGHIEQIEEQTALHRSQWERELEISREESASKAEEVVSLQEEIQMMKVLDLKRVNTISALEERARNLELQLDTLKEELLAAPEPKKATPLAAVASQLSKFRSDGEFVRVPVQEAQALFNDIATAARRETESESREGLQREVEDARKRLAEVGRTVVEKDHIIRELKRQLNRWSNSTANTSPRSPEEQVIRASERWHSLPEHARSKDRSRLHHSLPTPSHSNPLTRSHSENNINGASSDAVQEPLSPKPMQSRHSRQTFSHHDPPSKRNINLRPTPPLPIPDRTAMDIPQRSTSAPPPEGDELMKPLLKNRGSADTIKSTAGFLSIDVLPSILADLDSDNDTNSEFAFLRAALQGGEFSNIPYLVNLPNRGYSEWMPSSDVVCANLTHVYLDSNSLTQMPPCIFTDMPKLLVLNMAYNRIAEIPNDIGNLTELRELYLNNNSIANVGEGIARLGKLEVLDLSWNGIESLPYEIFTHTTMVEYINLAHNRLRFLPPSLGLLDKSLKGLFLKGNPLDISVGQGLLPPLLDIDIDALKSELQENLPDRAVEAEKMLRRTFAGQSSTPRSNRLSFTSVLSSGSHGGTTVDEDELRAEEEDADRKRYASADSGVVLPGVKRAESTDYLDNVPLIRSVTQAVMSNSPPYLPPAQFGSRLSTELSASLIEEYARPMRIRCVGMHEKILKQFLSFLHEMYDSDPNSAKNILETPIYDEPLSTAEGIVSPSEITRTVPQRRSHVIAEILATEKTYVRELENLVMLYMKKFQKEQWFGPREMGLIFGNIRSILMIHQEHLLPELIKTVNLPTQPLGGVFLAIAPFLKMYSQYYNNFDYANAYITQLEALAQSSSASFSGVLSSPGSSSARQSLVSPLGPSGPSTAPSPMSLKRPILKKIRQFLRSVKEHPSHSQISLQAFLILPVQRLPRYKLLLEQLLGCTGPEHPDHQNLSLAVDEIRRRVMECNENKRAAEDRERGVSIGGPRTAVS